MVGYDSDHRGYRIFHPPSRKVFVCSQVKFDESIFPLEQTKSVELSHNFATSTISGVPRYPQSGSSIFAPRSMNFPKPSIPATDVSSVDITGNLSLSSTGTNDNARHSLSKPNCDVI
ncbi:uncharacterized protein NDAI_0H01550 [Naumovozyma dairenensis CBS 421]|uniref:Retroviral polymerase SH3-like domain-containing protein n=1 Tax=Naumovozyma dairenensis (strain ATCC 10597 / BCRC 20456 / CBS 421 / NBRC 0211 / NRRL Y-12639) TaxID=1071378 RepID=G0WEW8_NAUDC|nr:hypothetical protein NDAI_0H01550 [Naumovozyma dairenensis CBS 421]CCD26329.1 hypothetical protein NDAI_0H01550 [Naumovozyma dairenensis CBS 421]